MPEHVPAPDERERLESAVSDLLTDFGAFIGEPEHRRRVVRRLVQGCGLTHGGVDDLRWYFQRMEDRGSVREVGAVVAAKLKDATSAKDTIAGASRLRDKDDRKKQSGENQHHEPAQAEGLTLEQRLEDWETGIYYWFTYESPDKGQPHATNVATTAEHFRTTATRVQGILDTRKRDAN